ncbi:MAG TPA: tetraacyldisaccharide 4'-kinase [Blastocatellia bacterium]|jgi:tetraacyldisaccharide 4'-kinase|nr:tetraacyldisaccharide 4'-kinase [Blastocatellia bacterium]
MFLPPVIYPFIYAPAKLYELGVRARVRFYENRLFETRRLNTPVISVGNMTVGGAGKTPCVAFLARFLGDEGYEVAILSRGYKREGRGRVEVSNGREILCGPNESGDEPFLLANLCPGARVIVDRDRYAAGKWLEGRERISVFLLDDGYQHMRLERDLNLLLIDASDPLDQARMIPFGRLREPLTAMRRADAVIVTRSDQPFDRSALGQAIGRYARADTPIFYAHHKITELIRLAGAADPADFGPAEFNRMRVAAVSGVARPDRFVADLERLGMEIAVRRDFDDHHRYTRAELSEIIDRAREARVDAIITTEKDAANLPAEFAGAPSPPIFAARIEFVCDNQEALKELVRRTIHK